MRVSGFQNLGPSRSNKKRIRSFRPAASKPAVSRDFVPALSSRLLQLLRDRSELRCCTLSKASDGRYQIMEMETDRITNRDRERREHIHTATQYTKQPASNQRRSPINAVCNRREGAKAAPHFQTDRNAHQNRARLCGKPNGKEKKKQQQTKTVRMSTRIEGRGLKQRE